MSTAHLLGDAQSALSLPCRTALFPSRTAIPRPVHHLTQLLLLWCLGYVTSSAALDPSLCPSVPLLAYPDQSPTAQVDWGRCTGYVDANQQFSNWCTAPDFIPYPTTPPDSASKCLKFGRMTVYTGPIIGKDANHFGACDVPLVGSDSHALVAVSTKYLNSKQSGWEVDPGACGQCMCVRLNGIDLAFTGAEFADTVLPHVGIAFAAKVGDR